jgi:glycosyltransferase involved in cell wall biosynthesis
VDPDAVTVIITARNAERTIAHAMRSVLRTLPESGRMLVRSDGSTDATGAAARSIRDDRVTVLEDEAGLGIAASCNALLDRVETPLVARMDADDISLPGRIAAQTRRIRRGIDFSFTTSVAWREGSPVVRPQEPYAITPASAPFVLLLTNPFIQSTMVARLSAVRAMGGYRLDVASEDFDLFVRAATAGYRFERLRTPRMVYRRSTTQTTAQASWWKAQKANPLVEQAFDELAQKTLGFVPGWFAWRRAGFPADGVPAGTAADIDRFRAALTALRRAERAPMLRRLARMETIARKAVA